MKTKLMNLKQMEPIARDATKAAPSGVAIPQSVRAKLVLGQQLLDQHGVFELYVPGDRPENAKVISVATVDRLTGDVNVEVRPIASEE